MSVPYWPTDLPSPTRAGYQSQRGDTRLTRKASGPLGYRSLFSNAPTVVGLNLELTRDLKAVFDGFYDDLTRGGILPFWMPDPTTDGWALLSDQGQPLIGIDDAPVLLSAYELCIFDAETPSEAISGARFNISFRIAALP